MILFILIIFVLLFIGVLTLIYRSEYKEYKKYYMNKNDPDSKIKSFFLILVGFILDCIVYTKLYKIYSFGPYGLRCTRAKDKFVVSNF